MKNMIRYNGTRMTKWGLTFLALVLTAVIPFAAFAASSADAAATAAPTAAESADAPAQQPGMGMGMGMGMGGDRGNGGAGRMDTSTLTDEQKAVYDKALTLYEQIEDSVLKDMVTAGVVAQADADAYTALREAEKSLDELDQSAWTADQFKAYYEANAKTGDERKTAMQALADAGQITQAQADAMSADGQNDLWSELSRNANTNSAIQTAMSILQQARQAMNSTLREAGISGVGNDNQPGGMGGNGMMGQPGGNSQGNDTGAAQNGPMQGGGMQNSMRDNQNNR